MGGAIDDQGGVGEGDGLVQQQRPHAEEVIKHGAELTMEAWIEGRRSLGIFVNADINAKGEGSGSSL